MSQQVLRPASSLSQVYLYRDPVDFGNYALRVVMRCNGKVEQCIEYSFTVFTAHNNTAYFGANIAMTLSVTLKHPFDTDGGNIASKALSFSDGSVRK